MRLKSVAAVFVAAVMAVQVFAAQAASPQNIFEVDYVLSNLKKGVTTKDQVLEHFGEPTKRDVKLTSEGGASETLIYLKGAPKKAAKSGGTGFGKMMGSLRGIVSDVSSATGKNVTGTTYAQSYDAQRRAEAADRLAARAGSAQGDAEDAGSDGASRLTIQLKDGVVSSYAMD